LYKGKKEEEKKKKGHKPLWGKRYKGKSGPISLVFIRVSRDIPTGRGKRKKKGGGRFSQTEGRQAKKKKRGPILGRPKKKRHPSKAQRGLLPGKTGKGETKNKQVTLLGRINKVGGKKRP